MALTALLPNVTESITMGCLMAVSASLIVVLPMVCFSKTVRSSIMITHVMSCLIIPYTTIVTFFLKITTKLDLYATNTQRFVPSLVVYESLVSGTLFILAPMFPFIHFLIISYLVQHRVKLRYISDAGISMIVMLAVTLMAHIVHTTVFWNPDDGHWPWERFDLVLGFQNGFINSTRIWFRLLAVFCWGLAITLAKLAQYSVSQLHIASLYLSSAYFICLVLPVDVYDGKVAVELVRHGIVFMMPIAVITLMLLMPVALWPTTIAPVLHNPIGCRAFLAFLETEYSGENLRYILALRRLQLLAKDTVAARALLDRIMSAFVQQTAAEMINLPDPIVRAITEYHAEFTKQCETDPSAVVSMAVFQSSIVDVSHMLEDSFTRFRLSSMYSTMVRDMQQQRQTLSEASVLSAMVRSARRRVRRRGTSFNLIVLKKVADIFDNTMAGGANTEAGHNVGGFMYPRV